MYTDYGTRKCLVCGAEFTATYPAQITCSKGCYRKRELFTSKVRNDARRAHYNSLKSEVERLTAELAKAQKELEQIRKPKQNEKDGAAADDVVEAVPAPTDLPKLEKNYKPVPSKERVCPICGKTFQTTRQFTKYCSVACRSQAKNPNKKKTNKDAEVTTMNYCERMKLSQLSPLPCGNKTACFKPFRCEACPPEAVERDFDGSIEQEAV